jgi:hypothetical protein
MDRGQREAHQKQAFFNVRYCNAKNVPSHGAQAEKRRGSEQDPKGTESLMTQVSSLLAGVAVGRRGARGAGLASCGICKIQGQAYKQLKIAIAGAFL